jgi:hypothetical protein
MSVSWAGFGRWAEPVREGLGLVLAHALFTPFTFSKKKFLT